VWREGALGPLGLALQGTGIGADRYLLNGGEVLEVFIQTDIDAIHGRVYMNSVWDASFYYVNGTEEGLGPDVSLTATTMEEPAPSSLKVLLAWVSESGFVNVQSRDTMNVTEYNAFSAAKQLFEGDGGVQPGLAATGVYCGAQVYVAAEEKNLELQSGGDDLGANWTTGDVSSL
jgi:hypothetical protein